jgi:hypothetical protein
MLLSVLYIDNMLKAVSKTPRRVIGQLTSSIESFIMNLTVVTFFVCPNL